MSATTILERISRRTLFWVVFAIAMVSNVVVMLVLRGNLPPTADDAMSYDCIAVQIAAGNGFALDTRDPEYLRAYREAPNAREYSLAEPDASVPARPTAFRPPGLPFVLAGIYQSFGRVFIIWRLIGCALIALAIATAAVVADRLGGRGVATIAAVMGSVDPNLKVYAGRYFTESMAIAGMALLLWVLVRLLQARTARWALATGATIGLLILARNLYVVLIPAIIFAGVVLAVLYRDRAAMVLRLALLCLIPAVLIPMPWWVRNCLLLDAFMPTGTQSGFGMPGGWSDATIANDGFWAAPEVEIPEFVALHRELEWTGEQGTISERIFARRGVAYAGAWIAEHPVAAVKLALRKAWLLWTRDRALHAAAFMLLGLFALADRRRRSVAWWAPWGLVILTTLAAMASWVTEGGRFILPLMPALFVLGALGGWHAIERLFPAAAQAEPTHD